MSKYDNYRSISQLTGIGTEELNKMSKNELFKLASRYGAVAERRRYNVIKFFEDNGIDPPSNYGYENKTGMRSWRLADFEVRPTDSAGKMKSKIRLLQQYLGSRNSTISGIVEQERESRNALARRIGVPTIKGTSRLNTLSKQYRSFMNALNEISGVDNSIDTRARLFKNSKTFWEIVERVNELYQDGSNNASTRVQLAVAEELMDFQNDGDSVGQIAINIYNKLEGRYVEKQRMDREAAPKYTSNDDFFEE